MKKFFLRNWESLFVELLGNVLCWILATFCLFIVAKSDWFGVKFLGQKVPISCEAVLVSNANLYLYDISLEVDWRNRKDLKAIIFYGKSDDFFIEASSLKKNDFLRLKRRLGLEGDGSFYGAELEVIQDPPVTGSAIVNLQIRSKTRIGGHKCDLFAFSEY